jgi:aldehyde dehydrogenase (NAD+)
MSADYDSKTFEAAINMVLDREKHDFPQMVGGLKIASGDSQPLISPVDSTIIFGTLQEPDEGTDAVAAEKAAEAFKTWSETPPAERAAIIGKAASLARTARYRLAAEVLFSTGMVRRDAMQEADRLIEVLDKAAADAKTQTGKPRGVWAIISLTSSPLASAVGYAAAAIAAGNTAVMMPSGTCPLPVYTLYKFFEQAGLPGGVLNIVADRKDGQVTALTDREQIAGVVASGCGRAIDDLMFVPVDETLGFINEAKGTNTVIVSHPASMKKAAKDVADSAFSHSGTGLYSVSRVIIPAAEEGAFVKALIEVAKDYRVGDPAEEGTMMGPLVSADQEKRFRDFKAENEGNLVFGGKKVTGEYLENGRYWSPMIFTGMGTDNDSIYEDQAIPAVCIIPVADDAAAVELLADMDSGLSVGVMSADDKLISRVKKQAAEGQRVFVNESSLSLEPARMAEAKNFVQ